MAERIPARLSASEGRKFAFTVGAAFMVLAALLRWRDATTVPVVLASLGLLLLAAGAVVPERLGPVQSAWMGMAHAISRVTTPIFMGLVYFLSIVPIGIIMRAAGRNPLVRKSHDEGFWVRRAPQQQRSDLERQF